VSEHEVDLIVARLRDELTARPDAAAEGRSDDSFFSVGRAQAERFWAEHHVFGKLAVGSQPRHAARAAKGRAAEAHALVLT
jgi:hypothetical protein